MITSKSSNSKKKMMFLTDSKDINFYLNNYLSNNSNTGEIDRSVLKGGLDVKTQFANEININGNKFVGLNNLQFTKTFHKFSNYYFYIKNKIISTIQGYIHKNNLD